MVVITWDYQLRVKKDKSDHFHINFLSDFYNNIHDLKKRLISV